MGFRGAEAKRFGVCFKVIIWGWQCKPRRGEILWGRGKVSLLLQILLDTVEGFIGKLFSLYYRTVVLPVLHLLRLQGQKCNLKCHKVFEIYTEL